MQKIGTPGAASQNWAFFACALRRTKPPVRREKTSSSEPSDTGLSGAFAAASMASTSVVFFFECGRPRRACVRACLASLPRLDHVLGRHARERCQQNHVGLTSALPPHTRRPPPQFEFPRLRRRQMQPWHLGAHEHGRKGRLHGGGAALALSECVGRDCTQTSSPNPPLAPAG